jgi:LmbE family N-acetylglucosaminyl deacetylase
LVLNATGEFPTLDEIGPSGGLIRVLHLGPHPDDELLGSPAVLMALAGSGHDVVNLGVSLGRPAERGRRESELREACARAGFALRICSPPHAIGRGDDLVAAQARLTEEVIDLGIDQHVGLMVAPSPHDGHHAHEVVGRAAAAAAAALRVPLWMWGFWSDLPIPTILHPFEQPVLDRITGALSAHASQLARNDYRRLIAARAQATAVLGPERVFGFGTPGIEATYAEVLCEAVPRDGGMMLGAARMLEPDAPLHPPTDKDLWGWLRAISPRDQLR